MGLFNIPNLDPPLIPAALRKQLEKSKRLLAEVGIAMEKFVEATEENAERVAEAGWVIPGSFAPREAHEVYKLDTEDELDSFFSERFDEDGLHYGYVKSRLLNNALLNRWSPLLRQAYWVIEENKHEIAVPALMTVFEGVVAQKYGPSTRIPDTLEDAKQDAEGFGKLQLLSLHAFTKMLYESSDFSKKEFEGGLNRHRALHGRANIEWRRVDAIKILVAIEAMAPLDYQ